MLRNKSNTYSEFLALAYSDIFDYPLREEELYKFQISNFKFQIPNAKSLEHWKFKNGYYYLKGREEIIEKRIKREQISQKKIIFAQKIAKILQYIPIILLIGLSGSLAMLNADEEADIDLFIITKHKTLWMTRFFVLCILQVFGVRRSRNAKKTQNVVCTNMLMDERNLKLPGCMQNLYTAHEVIQMRPIAVKNNIDKKFLKANQWIKEYLPNALLEHQASSVKGKEKEPKNFTLYASRFTLLESLAKHIQLWYMKKHRTNEIISDTLLAFHPQDQSGYVLEEFEKRLKKISRT